MKGSKLIAHLPKRRRRHWRISASEAVRRADEQTARLDYVVETHYDAFCPRCGRWLDHGFYCDSPMVMRDRDVRCGCGALVRVILI